MDTDGISMIRPREVLRPIEEETRAVAVAEM